MINPPLVQNSGSVLIHQEIIIRSQFTSQLVLSIAIVLTQVALNTHPELPELIPNWSLTESQQ